MNIIVRSIIIMGTNHISASPAYSRTTRPLIDKETTSHPLRYFGNLLGYRKCTSDSDDRTKHSLEE